MYAFCMRETFETKSKALPNKTLLDHCSHVRAWCLADLTIFCSYWFMFKRLNITQRRGTKVSFEMGFPTKSVRFIASVLRLTLRVQALAVRLSRTSSWGLTDDLRLVITIEDWWAQFCLWLWQRFKPGTERLLIASNEQVPGYAVNSNLPVPVALPVTVTPPDVATFSEAPHSVLFLQAY